MKSKLKQRKIIKNKLKIYLRTLLLILSLFFFWQCENEDVLVEPNQVDTQFEIILPSDGLNEIFGSANTQRLSNPVFSQINLEQNAKKISYATGVAQYTFALHNPIVSARNSNLQYTTDNLSVKVNPDGSYSTYIFRYIPDMSWFNIYGNTMDSYTGEIRLLTTDGDILNEFSLVNGEPITGNTASRSSATSSSACDITVREICVELIHADGYSAGLDCEITYNINCSGGGDYPGGGDPSNPDAGDDNPSGSGGGSSGGISSNPILGTCIETNTCEEEDNIENLIENECQKQIVDKAYSVTAPLNGGIRAAFGANNDYNLIYSADSTMQPTINAFTSGSCSGTTCDVSVKLRTSYLGQATNLSIARTVIHENVHALLLYLHFTGAITTTDSDPDFVNLAEAYANTLGAEAYANGAFDNLNAAHHHFMTDLVEDIATTLSSYGEDNDYSLPFSYYRKMAWGGLTGTDAFDTEHTADQQREIRAILEAENENETVEYPTLAGWQTASPEGHSPNTNPPCE